MGRLPRQTAAMYRGKANVKCFYMKSPRAFDGTPTPTLQTLYTPFLDSNSAVGQKGFVRSDQPRVACI